MRTRPLALIAAVAAAGLVMTATGIAAASPHHAASAATRTGTEYIQEMTYSATSPQNSHVIIYGVITAAGLDTTVGSTDHLRFPGGTFEAVLTTTGTHVHVDPGTCVATVTFTVTYKLEKGTGEFAGITGSGQATATVLNLTAPTAHGGCSTSKSIALQKLVEASGPVTVKLPRLLGHGPASSPRARAVPRTARPGATADRAGEDPAEMQAVPAALLDGFLASTGLTSHPSVTPPYEIFSPRRSDLHQREAESKGPARRPSPKLAGTWSWNRLWATRADPTARAAGQRREH